MSDDDRDLRDEIEFAHPARVCLGVRGKERVEINSFVAQTAAFRIGGIVKVRADSHQAAVARRQGRTQPEVAEQEVRRVLHDSRRHFTEVLAYARGPLRLGGLVERKMRPRCRRELVASDGAPGKHLLRDRGRGHGVRPARVEGEMSDDLR